MIDFYHVDDTLHSHGDFIRDQSTGPALNGTVLYGTDPVSLVATPLDPDIVHHGGKRHINPEIP